MTRSVVRWRAVHPTHLTLAGLVVGLASAAAVVRGFSSGNALVQVLAVVGWQIAYVFDCADGQLARLTGRSSLSGGELDVLVDVLVQSALMVAVGVVALDHGGVDPALVVAFAVTWGVSPVATLLAKLRSDGWDTESLTPRSPAVWVSRQLRDYAVAVLLVSLAAAFSPGEMLPWVMAVYTLVNGGALCAYVVLRAIRSLRS